MSDLATSPTDRLGPIRRSMCAGMLGLLAIALVPASSLLLPLTDVPTWLGLTIGIGLPLLCVAGAGTMRGRRGGLVGWLAVAATVAAGVVSPWLLGIGLVFGALYAGSWVLGARIDRERAEIIARHEAAAGQPDSLG